jgi:hypothetical protein
MIRTLATGCVVSLAMLAAGYAQAADKVGVAACDDFLTKYETCISSKVPAAQQATFKTQFDQTRKTWSDMAKNASTKPTLEASCKQTMDQMKTALQAYGCSF